MASYLGAVEIHLRPGALDPQGQAVGAGLRALGHGGVSEVRVGKHVRVRLEAADAAAARAELERMCGELLANPVLETFTVTLLPDPPGSGRD